MARGLLGVGADGSAVLVGPGLRRLLAGYGIPLVPEMSTRSVEGAVAAARRLGYPVAMKLSSPRFPHKSDVGGVETGLLTPRAVRAAAARVLELLGKEPGPAEALLVQPMLTGVELLAGVVRDSVLGAGVLVGLGGIHAELLDDVALELAPLDRRAAISMLGRLRRARLLEGYRGQPPIDREGLVRILLGLSRLAVEHPEVAELDLNPIFAGPSSLSVVDAIAVIASPAPAPPEYWEGPCDVSGFLGASSVAVVGASADPAKPGSRAIRYLDRHGFGGRVYPVNRSGGLIGERKAYTSVVKIPETVDLAVVAVPAEHVLDVIAECGRAGIARAVVFSSGFADAGPEGARLQAALAKTARRARIGCLGPNSAGLVSPSTRVCATFGMALEALRLCEGPVALLSQSGAVGTSLLSRALENGIGLAAFVHTGNEATLGIEAFFEELVTMEHVGAVALFLECLRRPAQFLRAAETAARLEKPVVVLKTGRSAAAKRAVASHTGSLAGEDRLYASLFRRAGAIAVEHVEDLVEAAHLMATLPRVRSDRVAVVTMSGGVAGLVADLCEAAGLRVPQPSEALVAALRPLLPEYAATSNPFDCTTAAVGEPAILAGVVRCFAEAGEYDLVLVQLTTNADPPAAEIAESLASLVETAPVPVLVGRLGAPSIAPRAVEVYRQRGIPVCGSPGPLVRLAALVVRYGQLAGERA